MKVDRKTQGFIASLPQEFREKFDYTNTIYEGSTFLIDFFCPLHGEQTQNAGRHKSSLHGCPECGREYQSKQKRLLGEKTFIKSFKDKYGDAYDLCVTDYTKKCEPCVFFCNKHNKPITDTPLQAEKRHPCLDCRKEQGNSLRKPIYKVLEESRNKFGNVFGYNFDNYTSCNSLIGIKCPKHSWFKDKLSNHLASQYGCPDCFKEAPKEAWNSISVQENINTLKDLYGDKYNFFTEDIKNSMDKVRYYCKVHHKLKCTRLSHLKVGYACNECGDEITAEKLTGWYTKKTVERQKDKLIKELNNIYIVHLKDNIFKIGIAKNPSARLCNIKTGSLCTDANYHFILELSTYDAFYLEYMIHKKLKAFRYKWDFHWKGYTECFILGRDQLEEIKEMMIEYKGNLLLKT